MKSDLRDHYPFGMLARPRETLVRLHASSGTTGKPTVVGYSARDIATWADLMARSMACAGARPGDVVHKAYGYGLFTGGLGAHYGGERLGATVVPMSGGNTERQIVLIQDLGARVLCATPSYALAIAEAAEKQDVDLRKSRLAIGLFGAEPWSEAMRKEIEARLGMKAIDIYGLSEIMGPGVACECGRTHLRLLRITGRNDDMLIIRGVNVYPSQIEAVLVGLPDLAPHYQLVVERQGALDQLTVEVEASALVNLTPESGATIGGSVRHHIKSMVGVTAEVRVKSPGEIPRSQGKAARVRDLRPKPA